MSGEEPVLTLGPILPERRRRGTRQIDVVPKLVEPLLMAAREHKNSYLLPLSQSFKPTPPTPEFQELGSLWRGE